MGSHTNFYLLILSLIRIKDELHRIKTPRLQPLIKLLQTKNIELVDYDEVIPDNRQLAKELGITVTKCNSWLKALWKEMKENLRLNPMERNEVIHDIFISKHWHEYEKFDNEATERENQRQIILKLKLPVTPRIGEEIEFEIGLQRMYCHGTVYQVNHRIEGKKQIIEVFAHPFENDYYRWMRLKKEYNAWDRNKYG